ncbi:MAG: hypothetical protein DRJ11_08335 [Candidatus Aminicenantes bacterium]|nr:GWxTD domain-containing protein [Candidatus Aminicenantes bacterium]RLE02003.1 MAG: hypothetical protein DRJ11_08335 [Candidatus Aminicenantes bacterium]
MSTKIIIKGWVIFGAMILGISLNNCGTKRHIELDVESQEFYKYARLIMTKEEKAIFNHLPDKASRQEFIADFWAKRDPDPETEENEYKEEFFRRIEYANQRFNEGTPGWKTDRGRIYIYLGQPDKIDYTMLHGNPEIKGAIMWWIYYRYGVGILFVDKYGYGRFTFDPYSGVYGDLFNAIEMAKLGATFTGNKPEAKFVNFNLKYEESEEAFIISIDPKAITFRENEEGKLEADFDFTFFIYPEKNMVKETKQEQRKLILNEHELGQMKEIVFAFDFSLPPGKYYFDVIIRGQPEDWKTRKIFELNLK